MFATRDQENLVREPFNAKSAKPLGNGGSLKQHPKTPGRLLVTPLAPRTNRAPLGERTGKTTVFKTPAPLTIGNGLPKTQKRSSAKKPKLKVHQAQVEQVLPESNSIVEEDEEREIEYCPPKIKELPDEPDDVLFGPDYDFSHLKGANIYAGWNSAWLHEEGEDGLTEFQRREEQNSRRLDAMIDHEILEGIQETDPLNWTPRLEQMKQEAQKRRKELDDKYFGVKASRSIPEPQKKLVSSQTSTISAQTAAAALSHQPKPHFAAPTAAARNRQRSPAQEFDAPRKRNISNLASKSTVGYAKGRKVAATLRPLAEKAIQPAKSEDVDRSAELLRKLTFMEEDQEDSDPLFEQDPLDTEDWVEKTFGNFRFSLPADEEEDDKLPT